MQPLRAHCCRHRPTGAGRRRASRISGCTCCLVSPCRACRTAECRLLPPWRVVHGKGMTTLCRCGAVSSLCMADRGLAGRTDSCIGRARVYYASPKSPRRACSPTPPHARVQDRPSPKSPTHHLLMLMLHAPAQATASQYQSVVAAAPSATAPLMASPHYNGMSREQCGKRATSSTVALIIPDPMIPQDHGA